MRRLGHDCVGVEPPRPPHLVEADLGVTPVDLDLPRGLVEGLRGDAVQLVRQPCSEGWKRQGITYRSIVKVDNMYSLFLSDVLGCGSPVS